MNELTIIVALVGGHVFTFTVQDWDTDESQPLSADTALGMARGLLDDNVALWGELNGVYCAMTIDPASVVALALRPAKLGTNRGRRS